MTAAFAPPAAGRRLSLGPVVSLGAHILDVLGRPVSTIPAGQQALLLDEIRATAAGTAAGTSVDMAKLGVDVRAMGAVGDDALGDLLVTLLQRHGVDTALLVRKPGVPTSATILPIRPNGERPALHCPGADHHLAPADLGDPHALALAGAAAVHVGAPETLSSFPVEAMASHLESARAAGAFVTLDVLRMADRGALEHLAPVLAHVDWFLPNEQQLRDGTGQPDLARAIDAVLALGTGGVAVTCGEDGCMVGSGKGVEALPALPVDVVDTTGCGDGFDAGFVTGLLLGAAPVDAAWLGVACGSLVATGLGSDAGITSLEETLRLLGDRAPEAGGVQAAEALALLGHDHAGTEPGAGRLAGTGMASAGKGDGRGDRQA